MHANKGKQTLCTRAHSSFFGGFFSPYDAHAGLLRRLQTAVTAERSHSRVLTWPFQTDPATSSSAPWF